MASVRAGPGVGKDIACHHAQAERIVEFAEDEQPGIGSDPRPVELQLEAAVERECKRYVQHAGYR